MSLNLNAYLERLNFIYYGLIAVPLVLFPVVYLPIKDGQLTSTSPYDNALIYIAGLLLFLVILFGRRLFRRNLGRIQKAMSIEEKLLKYRKISTVFYSFGLVACLVSVGLLLFTRHQLFIATYPILLLILSLYRPTVERLKRDLPLTEEDLAMINNKQ